MRPRGETESKGVALDLANLDDEEKGPQGVKIELQNVWFKYPTRDVPVLNGLNMTVCSTMRPKFTVLIVDRLKKVNLRPLSGHLGAGRPVSSRYLKGTPLILTLATQID